MTLSECDKGLPWAVKLNLPGLLGAPNQGRCDPGAVPCDARARPQVVLGDSVDETPARWVPVEAHRCHGVSGGSSSVEVHLNALVGLPVGTEGSVTDEGTAARSVVSSRVRTSNLVTDPSAGVSPTHRPGPGHLRG